MTICLATAMYDDINIYVEQCDFIVYGTLAMLRIKGIPGHHQKHDLYVWVKPYIIFWQCETYM